MRYFTLLLLALPAFAEFQTPDCRANGTFTGVSTQTYTNNNKLVLFCSNFSLTWSSSVGISALSIQLEGSDNGSSWTAFTGDSVVLIGTNPSTDLSGVIKIQAAAKLAFIRVRTTSVTGTGTIMFQLLGYAGASAALSGGGSGGGGGSGVTSLAVGPLNGITLSGSTGAITVDINPLVVPQLGATETITGAWSFKTASATAPNKVGTGAPTGPCNSTTVGNTYTRSDAQATNASVYSCNQTGSGVYTWELLGGGGQTLTSGIVSCIGPEYPCYAAANGGAAWGSGASALQLTGYKVKNEYTSQVIKKIALLGWTGTAKITVGLYNPAGSLLGQSDTISNGSTGATAMVFTFATPVTINTPWFWFCVTYEATGSSFQVFQGSTVQVAADAITEESFAYTFGTPNATQAGGIGTNITMPSTLGTATGLTGNGAGALPIALKVTD